MMKKSYGRSRSLSILLVVLSTLTITLGGCSSKKADESATVANEQTETVSQDNGSEAAEAEIMVRSYLVE